MALFFPSVTHQSSLMLTATAQSPRMAAVCICFLLLAGGSAAHSQAKKLQSCGKKELVWYARADNQTTVTAASPSGNDIMEFGTISVMDNVLRKGIATASTFLGRARGATILEKDLSISAVVTWELNIPGCTGSLTGQGTVNPEGNGELAITGGTGTFRFARGYVVSELVPVSTDTADLLFKDTAHLKYI